MESEAFIADVVQLAANRHAMRISSLAEARDQLASELDELHELITHEQPGDLGLPWDLARQRLLAIAATTIQAADQLGLHTRGQALDKAIPF